VLEIIELDTLVVDCGRVDSGVDEGTTEAGAAEVTGEVAPM